MKELYKKLFEAKKENTLLDKAITLKGMRTPTEQLNDLFEYFGTIFSDDKK